MRRGSARTIRRPRTGGVCGQHGRKNRLSCQIEAQRSGFDLERRSNEAQPKKRRARQRLPLLSRAKFAPTRPQEVYKKLSSLISRYFVFSKCSIPENAKMRYCSKATIAVFGKLGFSGSRKKRIARFAKRCVFVVSHSARLRISASPVSQLKRNSPHSPSQSAWYW